MAFFGPGSDQHFRPAPSDALFRPQSRQPDPGPVSRSAIHLRPVYPACHDQPARVYPQLHNGPVQGYQADSSSVPPPPQALPWSESGVLVPFPRPVLPPPSHSAAAHPVHPPLRAPSRPPVPFRSSDPFQSDPFRSAHPLRLDSFRPRAWGPEPRSWSAPEPKHMRSPFARPPRENVAGPWSPQPVGIPGYPRRPETHQGSQSAPERARALSAEDLQGFIAPATLVVSGLVFSVSVGAAQMGSLVTLVESALRARDLSGGVVGTRVLGGRRVLLHCSDAATAAAILRAHEEDRDRWRLLGTELEVHSVAPLMMTQAATAEPAAPGTEPRARAPGANFATPGATSAARVLGAQSRTPEANFAAPSARSGAEPRAEPAAPGTEAAPRRPPDGSSPGAFEIGSPELCSRLKDENSLGCSRVSMEDMAVSAEEGNAVQSAAGGEGSLGEALSEEKKGATNDFGKGQKRGVVLGCKHAAKILAQRTPVQAQRWQGRRRGLELAAKIWGSDFRDEPEERPKSGVGGSASEAERKAPKRNLNHKESASEKQKSGGNVRVDKRRRAVEGEQARSKRPRCDEAPPSRPSSYPLRTIQVFPVIRFPSTREVYATLRDSFANSPDQLIRAAATRVENVRMNDRDKEFIVTFTDRATAWRVLEAYGNLESYTCHYSSREKLFWGGKVVGVYPGDKSSEVRESLDGWRNAKKGRQKRPGDGMVGKARGRLADDPEALSKKRRRAEADRRALKVRASERRAREEDVGGRRKGVRERSAAPGAGGRAIAERTKETDRRNGTERRSGTERIGRSERTIQTERKVVNGKGGAAAARHVEVEKARTRQGPEPRAKESSNRIARKMAKKLPTLSRGLTTKVLEERPRGLEARSRDPESCTIAETEQVATGKVKVGECLQEARAEVKVVKKLGLQQERFFDQDFDLNF